MSPSPKKFTYRPAGAHKLLVHILYGKYSHMDVAPGGIVTLQSIRKLARLLGTQSWRVNAYLVWLEGQGYIDTLQYSENRRVAKFRLRRPSNVIYT